MKEGHSDIVLFGEILSLTMYALMEFKVQSDLIFPGGCMAWKSVRTDKNFKGLGLMYLVADLEN